MYKVDIIIPCYHNYQITKDAIESIYKHTKNIDFRIIAIIDGYDKDLIDYFENCEYIETIYHKHNLGFIKSVNGGLLKVRKTADYILLLNNDILIKDNKWLSKLIKTFDKDTAAVAPISDFVMGLQGQAYNYLPSIHYTKFLIGFCMLVRKDLFDLVGKLDERFGIGGQDDLDLSIRFRLLGYKLKINRGVFIHHLGFKSLSLVFKDYKEIEDRTRPMLESKWGKNLVDDLFTYTNDFILKGGE